MGPAEK